MSSLPHSPSSHRNRSPIWNTIRPFLSSGDHILEIASGTGEHIEFMAPQDPNISWQPSDGAKEMLWVINERNQHQHNVSPAQHIDVRDAWPSQRYDHILCINMIHISPWESSVALFSKAKPQKYLILYGPFMENGTHNSQGNRQFDVSLKMRDPRWGIRDIQDLIALGTKHHFSLVERFAMPANNQTLIWKHNNT